MLACDSFSCNTTVFCKIPTEALKINKPVLVTVSDLCFGDFHQKTLSINLPNVL